MKNRLLLYLFWLGILSSCHSTYTESVSKTFYYEPGSPALTTSDSGMLREIIPYQEKLNKIMSEVLVQSHTAMEKGKPESKLGNFVADVCFNVANKHYKLETGEEIDFCILNNGGLRNSLPAGEIIRKNVFELMPFENELIVLTVSGSTVSKILNHITASGGVPVSNLRMKINGASFSEVFIGGKSFDSTAVYKLVTSDYLANGGDAMSMLKDTLQSEPIRIKVRDALIDYMLATKNRRDTLKSELDGRISK